MRIQTSKTRSGTFRSGQSLVEILVAVSIGVLMITGALVVIPAVLRIGTDTRHIQAGAALGKELMDNVRVLAGSDWSDIKELATTSSNRFHLNVSTSPFTITSGTEDVVVATTTYVRSFYIDDAYRNVSGKIDGSCSAPSGSCFADPSTKRMTIEYSWPPSGGGSFTSYLTRSRNRVFLQTDWSGGSGEEGPITATSVSSYFSTSSGIDVSTTSGSIVVQGL